MTKITQISAAAMLAVFASTAFVATADAGGKKVWCKETSSTLFKTACEEQKKRKLKRYVTPTFVAAGRPFQNFRSRSDEELGLRSLDGGGGGNGGRK